MSTGPARLSHSLRTLREQWDVTREQWDDKVAQDFEKNHLAPLEHQTTAAVRGMEKMSGVMGHVRRLCS